MKMKLSYLLAAVILAVGTTGYAQQEEAVLLRLEDETQQVRVEAYDEDAARWLAIASGYRDAVDNGWLKIALPDGYGQSTLRVMKSDSPSPFAGRVQDAFTPEGALVDYPASSPRVNFDGAEGGGGGGETVIEEADIWAWQEDTLFFYNQYRGLQVIDMADKEQPVWLDYFRYPAKGEDLYSLGDGRVILIGTGSYWQGEQVALQFLKLTDGNLSLVDTVELEAGYYMDSRRYGDYLYVMTRDWTEEVDPDGRTYRAPVIRLYTVALDDTEVVPPGEVHPQSLGEADPAEESPHPRIVDVKTYQSQGWLDAVLTAQPDGILLSLNRWYNGAADRRFRWRSEVHVLVPGEDGIPEEVGAAELGGIVQDKFKMQYKEGILTTISQQADWTTGQFTRATVLENFSLEQGGFEKVGSLNLAPGESLFASRFYGDNVYIVTFLFVDPLFSIDNSNPSAPEVVGELEIPGWSNYIEWVENWLFAVGIEERKLTVSTFDVADPANMSMVSREYLSEDSWAFSEAQYDDQAISFFPADRLFMLPFTVWSWKSEEMVQAMQLVSWDEAGMLSLRGQIQHLDVPRRGTLMDQTVVTISGREVVTTDVTDPDVPVEGGSATLAWNVQHLIPHDDYLLQLESADGWFGYWSWRYPYDPTRFMDPTLYVTSKAEPNVPAAEIPLGKGRPIGVISRDSLLVLLQDTSENPNNNYWEIPEEQSVVVSTYDLTDPLAPVLLDEEGLESVPYLGSAFSGQLVEDGNILWASDLGNDNMYWYIDIWWPGPWYYQNSLSYIVSTIGTGGEVEIPVYKTYPLESYWNHASSWFWEDPILVASRTDYTEIIDEGGKFYNYRESSYLTAVDFANPVKPLELPRAKLPGHLVDVNSLGDGINHYLYFEPDYQTVEVWGWDLASAFPLFKQQLYSNDTSNTSAYSFDWMAPFHMRSRYDYTPEERQMEGYSRYNLDVWYHHPLKNEFEITKRINFGDDWFHHHGAMEPDYLISTYEHVYQYESDASTGDFDEVNKWRREFPNIWEFSLDKAILASEGLYVPAGIYGVEAFPIVHTTPVQMEFAKLSASAGADWTELAAGLWQRVGKVDTDAAGSMVGMQWLYFADSIPVVDPQATDEGDLWRNSDWFGWYTHLSDKPLWVDHVEHKLLYIGEIHSGNSGGQFLYDQTLGYLWTEPETYPYMYAYEQGQWICYIRGTGDNGFRWFYSLDGNWFMQ
ncbi:MAG: beta-propeller domain-containing protein [Puniceicoccaceae bacterium]